MTLPNQPGSVDRTMAIGAVDVFLSDPKWYETIEEYNWQIERTSELTIQVVLQAPPIGEGNVEGEKYTIRLNCQAYPVYPPEVQFINPATGTYVHPQDTHHLPILQAPYCYVHQTYPNYQTDYQYGPQLVCSSMSYGYYFSGHTPAPGQEWRPGTHDIGTTIWTIQRALNSADYKGRQA